jgi:hypothetical protein
LSRIIPHTLIFAHSNNFYYWNNFVYQLIDRVFDRQIDVQSLASNKIIALASLTWRWTTVSIVFGEGVDEAGFQCLLMLVNVVFILVFQFINKKLSIYFEILLDHRLDVCSRKIFKFFNNQAFLIEKLVFLGCRIVFVVEIRSYCAVCVSVTSLVLCTKKCIWDTCSKSLSSVTKDHAGKSVDIKMCLKTISDKIEAVSKFGCAVREDYEKNFINI